MKEKKTHDAFVSSKPSQFSQHSQKSSKPVTKLGATKKKNINFDDFEKEAKAKKDLHLASTIHQNHEIITNGIQKLTTQPSPVLQKPPTSSVASTSHSNTKPKAKRPGFGATTAIVTPQQPIASQPSPDETDYARRTFASQKSISSDQYHNYDTQEPVHKGNFKGATSISSDQYFNRHTPSSPNFDPDEALESVKTIANGFAERFISDAESDFRALKEVVMTGAKKISEVVKDTQQGRY